MALSRQAKERIRNNKLRKRYRFPVNVKVTESDTSLRTYQRTAWAVSDKARFHGPRVHHMPKIYMYVAKGPSGPRITR